MDEEKKQWGDHELSTFFAHKYLAREMINHFPTMHRNYHDDLQSYALAGLWRAIDEFRESLGIPFVTWARMKIRWAIKDGLRELDLLSRTSREELKNFTKVANELSQTLGTQPSWKQLREHGVDVDKAVRASQFANQDEPELAYWLNERTAPGPDTIVLAHDTETRMAKYIAALPSQMSIVIELMYYGEYSQVEVGEILGVGGSRISQIHSGAIKRLRTMIGDEFRDY